MNEDTIARLLNSNEHENIIKGLGLVGKEGSLADLQRVIKFSTHKIVPVRKAANDAAADLILQNLIQYFSKIKEEVRESLGKLLQRLDPDVLSRIGQELFCEDDERRLRAVQVLGLLGESKRIRNAIAEMVKDKDMKVRATAVSLLGRIGLGKDMTLVLGLLNDKDPRVRANTIESLEEIGNPAAVALLQRFKNDRSNRIRGNALKALWNLGYKNIIEELRAMMMSKGHLMRASAAWVIGEIGRDEKELIDLLATMVQDENRLVRENAIKSKLKIGGRVAEAYLRYLCDEDEVAKIKKKM